MGIGVIIFPQTFGTVTMFMVQMLGGSVADTHLQGNANHFFFHGNLFQLCHKGVTNALFPVIFQHLKLYFANEKKDLLVPETREVIHNVNTSLERLVVEQLIAGSQTGASPVLPKDTRILNVSLTDNICYVNLDSTFLNGEVEAADYIPVYALVNSLTELQTVNKVQITVNGSANVAYRNVISLAAPLEREEKYVESK